MSQTIKEIKKIQPQPGPQTDFLESEADIVVYGGSAGGGKTWALLEDPLRHFKVEGFNGAIFRRETPQIRNPGALWDQAKKLYNGINGYYSKETTLECHFEKSYLKFSHLEYEKDVENWDGTELCYIGFDELQQFLESQFWYLFSRSRSLCGVRPYIRATCMPDPNSWVKKIIRWWLDERGEYADYSKSGIIRYFIRLNDEMYWFDTREEALKEYPDELPKSLTFIPASVYDNKILLNTDKQYLSNLKALSRIERERKLRGNWLIKAQAGNIFKREWFSIVDILPTNIIKRVRYWDRAGTEVSEKNKNPCFTAGLKLDTLDDGRYIIEHISHFRSTSRKVRKNIKNVASSDGYSTDIWLEQEPGSSGIADVNDIVTMLSGFNARADKPTGDKVTRAMPVSAQAEAGNILLLRGRWNEGFLVEAENFEGNAKLKDRIDSLSGAFNKSQVNNKLQEFSGGVTEEGKPFKKGSLLEKRRDAMFKNIRSN